MALGTAINSATTNKRQPKSDRDNGAGHGVGTASVVRCQSAECVDFPMALQSLLQRFHRWTRLSAVNDANLVPLSPLEVVAPWELISSELATCTSLEISQSQELPHFIGAEIPYFIDMGPMQGVAVELKVHRLQVDGAKHGFFMWFKDIWLVRR